MKKGLFIVFEGPDGSGKSTIINLIYQNLKTTKYVKKIVKTREPGGEKNAIAEDIRQILLNKENCDISDRAEVLLFAASRAQHVHDFIEPNLLANNIVLCDRYIHSSLAYQGYGKGIDKNKIWEINKFAANEILPDIVFLLMLPPQKGIERILQDGIREFNRLDKEKLGFHKKVYAGYSQLLKTDKRIIKIDASKTVNQIFKEIYPIILKKIKDHYGR